MLVLCWCWVVEIFFALYSLAPLCEAAANSMKSTADGLMVMHLFLLKCPFSELQAAEKCLYELSEGLAAETPPSGCRTSPPSGHLKASWADQPVSLLGSQFTAAGLHITTQEV